MPLAFNSLSHGQVAFGFFNIESDMLLLGHDFFFSTTFCAYMTRIAEKDQAVAPDAFTGMTIDHSENIGDLNGAIRGIHHTGFIGALYRLFPFPENSAEFKQKPEGKASPKMVQTLIAEYGRQSKIPFIEHPNEYEITLGAYRFAQAVFHQLLDYVWVGGLPQWKDGKRPGHVQQMKAAVSQSRRPVFKGMRFSSD